MRECANEGNIWFKKPKEYVPDKKNLTGIVGNKQSY
jgi:hypothetical protein